ncbi:MAG: hemerythrin domain-containing protein [Specibacter sp.]
MESGTLGQALELEHREIDGGIEAFVASLDGPELARPAPLLAALSGLRRHIYLEEEFLFPPLKTAGLMGPIFVMLREHGRLWKQMDSIESLLAESADAVTLRTACTSLLELLDAHNSKEEPIIYTQADGILDEAATGELLHFLTQGTTPEGWVCSAA